MDSSGQGTTEYLLIAAAIIIFMLFIVSQGGGLLAVLNDSAVSSSRSLWSGASPFSLIDWSLDSNGKMSLVLKNNSFEKIGFNGFNLSSTDVNQTDFFGILPGAKLIIFVSPNGFLGGCERGTTYSFKKSGIWIDYNTDFASGLRESAPADIVGDC